jgi:zinc protease
MPIVDRIIAEYLETGPDEQIVENAKLGVNMYMIGALERSSAVGRMLAEGYLYSDNPLFINEELKLLNAATPAELRDTASRWLTRGYYELTVLPFPEYATREASVDRSTIPGVTADANINFPDIATATLSNGMNLVVATRDTLPIIDVSIRIDTGGTASPPEAPGLATFAMALMDKGTKRYDLHELAAAKDEIAMGGQLQAGVEDSAFNYRILHSHLERSCAIRPTLTRSCTSSSNRSVPGSRRSKSLLPVPRAACSNVRSTGQITRWDPYGHPNSWSRSIATCWLISINRRSRQTT